MLLSTETLTMAKLISKFDNEAKNCFFSHQILKKVDKKSFFHKSDDIKDALKNFKNISLT